MNWKGLSSGLAAATLIFAAGYATAEQSASKRAYLLVQADVTNPQQYAEYAKLSPGTVAKFGGTYLARAGRTATLEGRPALSRVVVVEFPSFEQAQGWYNSPEYTAARKLREGAASAQFVVVEGQ